MPNPMLPLRALQVFEAAARLMSFKTAADELCLSPSAVSRQIQSLEARLGLQLFQRLNRAVALTPEGADFARDIAGSFQGLRQAMARHAGSEGRLRLSVAPHFSATWLMPRIPHFQAQHPGLTVELQSNRGDDLACLERYEADAVILHGMPELWPGFEPLRLLPPISFVPVCAPGLRDQPLSQLEELADHTLLVNGNTPWVWDWYTREVGVQGLKPARQLRFDDFTLFKQALLQGLGIAIAPMLMEAPLVRENKLVRLWGRRLQHPSYNYYLLQRRDARPKPPLVTFVRWLRGQIVARWEDYREPS